MNIAGYPLAIGVSKGTLALIKLTDKYYLIVLYGIRVIVGIIRPK